MGSLMSTEETFNTQPTHPTQPTHERIVYDYTAQAQYRRQVDDYRRRMDDVIRENKALKHYNDRLRDQLHELNTKLEEIADHQKRNIQQHPIRASVSTEHIKKYVDEMLENSDINIYGFPDAIEKQIYRNMFNMLLNVVDHTLDTSEVVLFGHKIVFDIQPLDRNHSNNIDNNDDIEVRGQATIGSQEVAKGVQKLSQ